MDGMMKLSCLAPTNLPDGMEGNFADRDGSKSIPGDDPITACTPLERDEAHRMVVN